MYELADLIEGAHGPDAGIVAAGDRQALGLGAGGKHAAAISQPAPAGQRDRVSRRIQRHGAPTDQRHRLLEQPRLGFQRQG